MRFHVSTSKTYNTNIQGQGEESLCIATARNIGKSMAIQSFWMTFVILFHALSSFVYIHFFQHCEQLKPSIVVCHPQIDISSSIFQPQVAKLLIYKWIASLYAHQNLLAR